MCHMSTRDTFHYNRTALLSLSKYGGFPDFEIQYLAPVPIYHSVRYWSIGRDNDESQFPEIRKTHLENETAIAYIYYRQA